MIAPPAAVPDPGGAAPTSGEPLVRIAGLGRNFGDKWAVRGLDLDLPAGRITGFIGPNGAGKSTTMRILATLDLPSEGACRVAGLDSVDDAAAVRRLVGYMPDSYGTYPNMTVEEYLDFFARAYGLHGAKRRTTIADLMAFCQLDGLKGKTVASLSKGMKQRLCLGRCLVNDPRLLILDEPTAGLDPRARIEFRDLLRILAGQGRAVIISSHILSELEEVCDQVAIIELGRLVAQGTVSAVKARARAAVAAAESATPGNATAPRRIELRFLAASAAAPAADAAVRPAIDLKRLLAEQPGIGNCRDEGHGAWTADFLGGADDQASLIARLVAAGAPLYHVAAREGNLEDAFMRLTEGAVQ